MQVAHALLDRRGQAERHGLELIVHRLGLGRGRDDAVKILLGHGDGAVDQIAQHVCQIRVDALADQLVGDHAVVGKGHLMQHIVAHRVHAEQAHQIVRVDHVAERLGHFALAHEQPRMAEHLLGQRLAQRHQEDRPVDGVEADDVLADQVHVRRPELLVMLVVVAVRVVAAEGDIVGQRVQPDVDHMARVKVHRHAPGERGAGHAQVLQAGL